MPGWLETYRGTVARWEVDNVGHFTIACYFGRFGDASGRLLEAIGFGSGATARRRRACVTRACYARFLRELRAGDILHMTGGVIRVDADGLVLGHRLVDSAEGALCAVAEQRVLYVDAESGRAVRFSAAQRKAAEAWRVEWEGPACERRPQPRSLEGFRDTARDTIKPREAGLFDQVALSAYIHRFSAANAHAMAAIGMTPAYQRDERRGFSTFELRLELVADLRPGDRVSVKSALLHVGKSSLRVFHRMFNERSREEVATLDQFGVHLDLDARRPAPLPAALKDRAQALLAPTVGV